MDSIGPVVLEHTESFSMNGNSVKVAGYSTTQAMREQIRELFRKAPGNVSVSTLLGGVEVAYDVTDDSILTQYCMFASTKAKSGWFALLGLDYTGSEFVNHWGFTFSLFYLGSDADVLRELGVYGISDLTNDWGI
jgi:hypothetical protein